MGVTSCLSIWFLAIVLSISFVSFLEQSTTLSLFYSRSQIRLIIHSTSKKKTYSFINLCKIYSSYIGNKLECENARGDNSLIFIGFAQT